MLQNGISEGPEASPSMEDQPEHLNTSDHAQEVKEEFAGQHLNTSDHAQGVKEEFAGQQHALGSDPRGCSAFMVSLQCNRKECSACWA